MRDIAVTLAVFGSLPFILRRPWLGILVWSWLGFMNPHRMAWGFSTTMPFAYIVAVTTLAAWLISKEPKRIPWTRESGLLACYIGWIVLTTIFAAYPELALEQLLKILKIQLMIFVAMALINNKEKLNYLVLVIALSIAFYGVKGGIFTILHGGVYRVQGPPGTFIGGNNELGLAMAMTVPLLNYLARQTTNRAPRFLFYAAMVLTAIAAIGTQSRGALLGMTAMGLTFWWKARNKFVVAILGAFAVLSLALIMPEAWYARMGTIQTYEQDTSATSRLNAWGMAFNLAKARITGGGLNAFQPGMFYIYAPDPENALAAHSIYFQVLGEHGFLGLGMFLLLGALTWLSAGRIKRTTARLPELKWLGELAAMVQASLVGYAAAGAFLGLANFDYYYNLILIVVVAKGISAQHKTASKDSKVILRTADLGSQKEGTTSRKTTHRSSAVP